MIDSLPIRVRDILRLVTCAGVLLVGGPVSSWRKELDRPYYCLRDYARQDNLGGTMGLFLNDSAYKLANVPAEDQERHAVKRRARTTIDRELNLLPNKAYQEERQSLFTGKRKPAYYLGALELRTTADGKYAGEPYVVVTVNGVPVGELSARHAGRSAKIFESCISGAVTWCEVRVDGPQEFDPSPYFAARAAFPE